MDHTPNEEIFSARTEKLDSCFCPYCGAQNPIGSEKCVSCGADISQVTPEVDPESTWHIVKENYERIEESVSPNTVMINQSADHRETVRRMLIALGVIFAILLAVGISARAMFSRGEKDSQGEVFAESAADERTDENAADDENAESVSAGESVTAEESLTEETASVQTEPEEPESEPAESVVDFYTAPSLLLTAFGGETKGNEFVIHSSVRDNHNNEYQSGLGGKTSNVENCTEYYIGDQYHYFSFRVVMNYDKRTDVHPDTYVRVYADGPMIYQSEPVRSGYEPTDVTLDIRGVKWLKLGICGSGDIRVVDPVLHNDEGYDQYSTVKQYTNQRSEARVSLFSLQYWNGSSAEGGLEYITKPITDAEGNTYNEAFAGTHDGQENWVEYDIAGCGYQKFTGTIIMNPNPEGVDTIEPIVVICENAWTRELYRSSPVTEGSGVQRFEVSLANTDALRVKICGKHNIRLVDCYLSK